MYSKMERIVGLYKTAPGDSFLEKALAYILWKESDTIWRWTNVSRGRIYPLVYNAPPRPDERLHIDPNTIEYFTDDVSMYKGSGRVIGGSWDLDSNCLNEHWITEGLKERFVHKMAWEDTTYVQHADSLFSSGRHLWGYNNIDQFIDERCEYVDNLYESMSNEGYQTDSSIGFPQNDTRRDGTTHGYDPLICIGRRGEFIIRDGRHRLIISQIIDVSQIPIMVLARHSLWQDFREYASHISTPLNPIFEFDFDSHPDLIFNQPES